MLPRSALTFALAVLVCVPGAFAQTPSADDPAVAPAHVSHVEGAVSLEREGRPENAPLNMPLLSGDRLRSLDGRAEVLFADGSALHIDSRTTVDVQSDDLIRLIDGRLRLQIVGPARVVGYRIDSPAGSVRITQAGEYRISLLHRQEETQLELAVVRGAAEILTDQGTTPVRSGERAYASDGLMPSYPYAYNSATWDAFDRWSEARRDARLGVSSQYLPDDVRPYASTFDEYGDWRYQPTYGYVWYPRVAASWRPYYYGRWMSYPRYGWTWIGADGFAWPTHHYGRWGFSAGVWFWIPASRWAPAYVSWAYSPGYVSWCPLGFDNRAVIGVNAFHAAPGYYSSARAWTAVSSSHFGRDYYVHQRAVNWDRFDGRTSFQVGRAAPALRDVAVPRGAGVVNGGSRGAANAAEARNAAPIRWAGSAASSASRSPRYVNRGDDIIHSPTERPTSPVRAGQASSGERLGMPRTAPDGPGRRIDAPDASQSPSGSRVARPPAASGYSRAVPRGDDARAAQPRPDSSAYQPRSEAPSYQSPRAEAPASQPRGDARAYQPREAAPARRAEPPQPAEPRPDAPQYRPRSYEPAQAHESARPRGGADSPPAPSAAPPAPNAGQRQAPPPERAAPSASPSRGGGNGGAERATPRSGGTPAGNPPPRRGGRGGH